MPLAKAIIKDYFTTSSDYFTLSLTLPDVKPAPNQLGRIRVITKDELKWFAKLIKLGAARLPTADLTTPELDELTTAIMNLLTSAAKTASRPTRKGGHPAP
jgi:hypothetical protein